MALARRSWQACLRVTMQLLPDLLVTGATPVKLQGGVIASLQGIEGFCEQRGEDDPSYSRQGCEDLQVVRLPLPRLDLIRGNEPGCEGIDLLTRLLEPRGTCPPR
jgi:hypothetical protein